ncbi:flagellar protein FliT [Planococcus halotolerans]|uniref:Flagellar protein FliT n=1 Tax=Planococcus halotolerans TaxID=2233542 RepID=A0A365KQX9_9BACL|nr:flagellar protein FliT [Planococcus halotolerans]QHJ69580.1 flagellar protein FliT [Planococcus halotolerans]RAZ75529.1 flagellar protein FliT [Planococcus halotolerans]
MDAYQLRLAEFLELTEKLNAQAKTVHSKMENNEEGQLESVQVLFERRQAVINQLSEYTKAAEFEWTSEDKKVISQLKGYEDEMQPLLNRLHQSFTTQMNRLNQTSQASKKYVGAYQTKSTEGSFIDQRK